MCEFCMFQERVICLRVCKMIKQRECSMTIQLFSVTSVCFDGSCENMRLLTAIWGRFCISGSPTLNEFRQTTELRENANANPHPRRKNE